jgi:hypothetical protein
MLAFSWLKELPLRDAAVSKSARLTPSEDIVEEDIDDLSQDYGSLADIFLYIDYVGANGQASHRAITIRSEAQTGSQPSVYAWCHVRKRIRQFRLDRIQSITTEDGEFFTPPALFWKSIGFAPGFEIAVSRPSPNDALAALDIKREFAPELVVLAALAKSDGAMHPRELDKIINHVERELEWSRRSLSDADVSALRAHVCRMRITSERIEECVNDLLAGHGKHRLYGKQLERFFKAATEIVAADGQLHDSEMEFLDYLQSHLE